MRSCTLYPIWRISPDSGSGPARLLQSRVHVWCSAAVAPLRFASSGLYARGVNGRDFFRSHCRGCRLYYAGDARGTETTPQFNCGRTWKSRATSKVLLPYALLWRIVSYQPSCRLLAVIRRTADSAARAACSYGTTRRTALSTSSPPPRSACGQRDAPVATQV